MRRLYLLTSFVIIISSIIHSQWINQNPVPNGNDLWSTFFIDDIGWIVGSEGFIKKTTNAGLDWIEQNSGTTLILKSVQFVDQNTGWICGETGLIMKTTDGGQNWFSQTSGTTKHLTDIDFYDLDTGYAVGFGGTILKTTDGGSLWITQYSGTSSDIYDVDFVDALVGYAVGGEYASYTILKTTDGGSSWVDKYSEINLSYDYLLTVNFIDANTGLIGGGIQWNNFIYKTTDGGDTWVRSNISYSKRKEQNYRENLGIYYCGGINSIYFKDSNIGYAVSGDGSGYADRTIYITTDGGSNWNNVHYSPEQSGLISVCVNSSGQGWAVGFRGVVCITEDDGSSWVQILSGKGNSCASGDDIYSVFFINKNIGWAVGARADCLLGGSIILKTTNGGKIWKTQIHGISTDAPVKSVYFIDEYFGWALEDGGMPHFFRTTDGGENWIEGVGLYSSVIFINQYTGWATNNNDYGVKGIYKSTDSGITWVQKSSFSSSSVYFSDINTGWAVGESGNILKSTDSGETWLTKTSGTTNDLNCVKFYDSNLGVCVGSAGIILLSTDGGESWVSLVSGTTNDLNTITFTNSTSIWIAGANGTILNTFDLGNNWSLYDGVTENNLNSICFINEYTGWIGGMNGTMFKYQNDVVPVELISFTANVNNNEVQLNWRTATEVNNFGFEILRQAQDDRWDLLGFVEGHGNSSIPNYYSFIDKNPMGGSKFNYRLKQVDIDGKYKYSNEIEVEIVPNQFTLYQNYPNPFNPTTKIRYQLPKECKVVIKIYDILGAEVLTLLNEKKEPGVYDVELNAQSLSSGTYIYKIVAGDPSASSHNGQAGQSFVEARKMILLR